MSSLSMRQVSSVLELDSLRDAWSALESAHAEGTSPQRPTVFQSWNWNREWIQRFLGDDQSDGLDVRTVYRDEDLVAILPFFVQRLAGPVGRVVQFLGHRMSYHNDVLLSPSLHDEEIDEIIELLRERLRANEIIHLRHLHGEARLTQRLISGGLATRQCRRILLHDDPDRPDPLTRLTKSRRRNLKNRRNCLAREQGCEFVIRTGPELGVAFDHFLDLHRRRFKSIGKESLLDDDRANFLRAAIGRTYEHANFEIIELVAEGGIVASLLMARDEGRYFNVNFGFDPEFDRYSPMNILLAESIRRGFRELACPIYDFGPGYERYKLSWDPGDAANYFACFGGRQPTSRLLASSYRKAFERLLPPDAERS